MRLLPLTKQTRLFVGSQFFRFLLAGGSTTAITYLIYLVLLTPCGHRIAYAIAFVVGVTWAYSVNTRFVFVQRWQWKKLVQFPVVYIAQYIISALLLELMIDRISVPEQVAPLIVVPLMLPLTFVLSRAILKTDPRERNSEPQP